MTIKKPLTLFGLAFLAHYFPIGQNQASVYKAIDLSSAMQTAERSKRHTAKADLGRWSPLGRGRASGSKRAQAQAGRAKSQPKPLTGEKGDY